MWKRLQAGLSLKVKEPVASLTAAVRAVDAEPAQALPSQQAIQQLQPTLTHLLIYEFNLGETASRLCPVLLEDQTVAILAVAEHVEGDAIRALAAQVQEKGYVLAQPARYVLSPALLLELIRNPELQPAAVAQLEGGHTPWSQADLFNAFLDIVRWGVQHNASDIHLNLFMDNTLSEVRFSIAGRYICPTKYQGISTQFLNDILSVAWMNIQGGNGAVFDPYKEQQGSLVCEIEGQSIMLRWGALAAEFGPSVCLRILQRDQQQQLPTLSELGYLPSQQRLLQTAVESDGGAIVFSGAVGSGKSTTLASLVSALPSWRKVISIEDPVEYIIPNAVQVSLSRDLHHNSHEVFAAKLRALKRSAMSDVLLGEIRDEETGRAFTDLSSSGVRLYTTVHANSASLVPARLSSDFIGVSMDLLASPGVLRLIVHQCLLPRLCVHCSMPLLEQAPRLNPHLKRLLQGHSLEKMRVRNPLGCAYCNQNEVQELRGWQGRIVCAELLDPTELPGFLDALAQGRAPQPVLMAEKWPDIRSSALMQSLLGLVDPFDVETYFSAFSSPIWQQVRLGGVNAEMG